MNLPKQKGQGKIALRCGAASTTIVTINIHLIELSDLEVREFPGLITNSPPC